MADEAAGPGFGPRLLPEIDSWYRVFFTNLRDVIWPEHVPPLRLLSWPAAPWPDVFVHRPLPWWGLLESIALHLAVVVAVVWAVPFLPKESLTETQSVFQHHDVIYYTPSEYLPPLDTGQSPSAEEAKGEPERAAQAIISVPPEADNRRQTIVTPSNIKLTQDVPLPNIVAWTPTPVQVPIAATAKKTAELKIPALNESVVAPAPDVNQMTRRQAPTFDSPVARPRPEVEGTARTPVVLAGETTVVAPPPTVAGANTRRLGDINMGHADVVAPAPRLPVAEQRTIAGVSNSSAGGGPTVVAPPPSMAGAGISSGGGGRIIALNVRPAPPSASAEIPSGNRRGTFAAGPGGQPGAEGTPGSPSGTTGHPGTGGGNGGGDGVGRANDSAGAPSGLYVGAGPRNSPASATTGDDPKSDDPDNRLMASVTPPQIGPAASEVSPAMASALERQVFGERKFYSMRLNMPNLNSAGGSWVIRFAELQEDNNRQGNLTAPVATRKVDPAYPLEMMRRNVKGTVTLYAVIRSDGSVGDVKVLSGVNDQLDAYARAALSQWRFSPATKNGSPVALEAVVAIPFKPFPMKRPF
ncbi:MAG TPA: TonB family protein [Terriglobales bacterium]